MNPFSIIYLFIFYFLFFVSPFVILYLFLTMRMVFLTIGTLTSTCSWIPLFQCMSKLTSPFFFEMTHLTVRTNLRFDITRRFRSKSCRPEKSRSLWPIGRSSHNRESSALQFLVSKSKRLFDFDGKDVIVRRWDFTGDTTVFAY